MGETLTGRHSREPGGGEDEGIEIVRLECRVDPPSSAELFVEGEGLEVGCVAAGRRFGFDQSACINNI